MTKRPPRKALACLLVFSACGGATAPGGPTTTASPTPTATVAAGLPVCTHPGISDLIISPRDGAVLKGVVQLNMQVVEISCINSARTCLTIRNGSSATVGFVCLDIGFDRLDTTRYPNGLYTLFAQPACRESPICSNGQLVRVEIRN